MNQIALGYERLPPHELRQIGVPNKVSGMSFFDLISFGFILKPEDENWSISRWLACR